MKSSLIVTLFSLTFDCSSSGGLTWSSKAWIGGTPPGEGPWGIPPESGRSTLILVHGDVSIILVLLLTEGLFLLGEFSGVGPLEPLWPGGMVLIDCGSLNYNNKATGSTSSFFDRVGEGAKVHEVASTYAVGVYDMAFLCYTHTHTRPSRRFDGKKRKFLWIQVGVSVGTSLFSRHNQTEYFRGKTRNQSPSFRNILQKIRDDRIVNPTFPFWK